MKKTNINYFIFGMLICCLIQSVALCSLVTDSVFESEEKNLQDMSTKLNKINIDKPLNQDKVTVTNIDLSELNEIKTNLTHVKIFNYVNAYVHKFKFIPNVISLDFSAIADARDHYLPLLRDFTQLRSLNLSNRPIRDLQLQDIACCPSLEILNLSGTAVHYRGIKNYITRLQHLKSLDLSDTVTGTSLAPELKSLVELKELHLGSLV